MSGLRQGRGSAAALGGLLALLLLLLGPGGRAAAADPLIEGLVENGTHPGRRVAGVRVELFGLAQAFGRFVPLGAQTTDEGGRFRFQGFDPAYDRYGVTVEYAGVPYRSELGTLAEEGRLELRVTVYETTTDTSQVAIERVHLLVRSQGQGLEISEILLLSNSGRHAVLPPQQGFLYPLPLAATEVELADPLLAATARTSAQGIQDFTAVPPEGKEIVFTYRLPPGPLERRYPFGVRSLALFLAEDGPRLRSAPPRLSDAGIFSAQSGARFRRYEHGALEPGESLPLVLEGGQAAAGGLPAVVWGAAGLAAGGAALWALAAWGRLRQPGRSPRPDRREELFLALAELDLEQQAGRLAEDRYREERARLKAELRGLLLAEPGRTAAGEPRD